MAAFPVLLVQRSEPTVTSAHEVLRVGPPLICGFVSVVWVGYHILLRSNFIATVTTKQSSYYLITN